MRPHNIPGIAVSALRVITSKSQKVFTSKLKACFPNTRTRSVALFVFLALGCAAFYSTSSASPIGMLLRGYISGRAAAVKTGSAKAAPSAVRKNLPAASAKTQRAADEPILESGNLNIERRGHTATKLAGGRILIVGGENEGGLVKKSEIFDPGSRQFSFAAKLKAPRTGHTATTLADGRVLVVGGRGRNGSLASTEIFDPATESFSRGPSLNLARGGHTATALVDGRVLIAGGDAEGSAEIFDPAINTFTLIGSNLGSPRRSHSAVLLKSGKVLIAGGVAEDGSAVQAGEIFDPETMGFSATHNNMLGARTRPTLRVLPDGKVQVIGGDQQRTMEMFNSEGEYFTAYSHIASDSSSLSEILRARTRAALINESSSGQIKLLSAVPGHLGELLDRSDHSLTEIPESGEAVIAGGKKGGKALKTVVIMDSSGATVTTDQTDYAPGDTVTITGTGWQAGETVGLRIHRDGHDASTDTLLSAVANASGNISNSEFVIQESDLGVTFLLTATGQLSGRTAQTTFTDGNVKVRTNASGITFDLDWTVFNNLDCTGAVNDADVDPPNETVGFSGGAQFSKGVAANDSIQLVATPFSDQGGAFINWSREGEGSEPLIVFVTSSLTVCVPGNFTGTRTYIATYAVCTLTCPANVTANTSADGTGNCSTTVTYTAPTTGGTCGAVTCSPATGSVFPKGTTIVTCTSASTGATCSFTVTVNDNENPTFTSCPSTITTSTAPGVCTAAVPFTVTAADNCTGVTFTCMASGATTGTVSSGSTFNKGTTAVSCTATDTSGNTSATPCSFTVTVNDTEKPTFTSCPSNITTSTASGACRATVPFTVTAADNCPGVTFTCTASGATTGTVSSGSTFNKGTTAVSCTATDASGNTSATPCSFTVTVNDTENPQISCPANIVRSNDPGVCGAVVTYAAPVGTDNCPGATTVQTAGLPSGSFFPVGTTTNTFKVTDASGNMATCSFTVTVNDTENPQITCPSDMTQANAAGQCSALVNYTTPVGTDNCPGATTSCSPPSGSTFAVGTTPVTCTVTDAHGHSASCTFNVTVNDTENPQITCPSDVTQANDAGQCSALVNYTAPVGTDNCAGATTSCSPPSGSTFPGGTTQVNCTVTDAHGHSASCTFNVTVNDTENPQITCPANTTVQCDADVPAHVADTAAFSASGGTASDNCDPPPTVAFVGDEASGSCPKIITRTYKATDSSGNESTCTQTITVDDTTPPTIGSPGANATIECPTEPVFAAPTATDNCDPNPTVTEVSDLTTPSSCPGTYSRTKAWKAKDACNNESGTVSQTITVVDTTPPTLSGAGANATIECPVEPVFTAPTATDSCDPNPTVTEVSDVTVPSSCPGTYSRTKTWKATDCTGNMSGTVSQTITVVDTAAPTLSGGGANAAIECPAEPVFTAPTATDTCDPNPHVTEVSDVTLPGSCPHTYSRTKTWKATDCTGNMSGTVSQTINVVDTTRPTISDVPDATVECGTSTEPTATGTATGSDTCGNVTITHTDGPMSDGCGNTGSFVRTWRAEDECRNISSSEQTITIVDTTPPTITEVPDATVECGTSTEPAATGTATASDTCGNVTITHSDGPISDGCGNTGSFVRTWRAEDECHNVSTSTQPIAIVDTTAPTISDVPDATVECGANADTSPGATGTATGSDTCGNVTITHSDGPMSDGCGNTGSFVRTWRAEDECHNVSTSTQTITIVDTTRPTVSDLLDATVECGTSTEPTATGTATGSDTCGNVTITHSDSFAPACGNTGVITRTWRATDECGNFSTSEQTITIVDTTAPVISCPSDTQLECNASTDPSNTGTATATDNCGGTVIITFTDAPTAANCTGRPGVNRTWKATDGCGNMSTCVQHITFVDTTPPTFPSCPADITVRTPGPGQPAVVTFTTPTATDNCDPNPSEECTPPSGSIFPVGTTTVTCTARDACDNRTTTGSCTFKVTVPACVTNVIVEANFTRKGSNTAHKAPVVGARVVMLPKARVQANCNNLLDAPCVWTNLAAINTALDPVFTTGTDGSVVVYSSVPDPNGWSIYIDMYGKTAAGATINMGTTKIAVANTDCAPNKRFTAILVADSTGTNATAMTQRQQHITGSLLEITYPEQVEWDGTDFLYPLIFTSDSDWEVDVCASVPQGYRIRGNPCEQLFVANETKVIFFDVEDIGSPEPRLQVRGRVKHHGRVTPLDFDVPGVRKKNKK